MSLSVSQSLKNRFSVRAFTSQVPDKELIKRLLEEASASPSAGNLQPWHIVAVTGEPLKAIVQSVSQAKPVENDAVRSYPPELWEPYRTRRYKNGERMYQMLGIAREDKAERLAQQSRNARFFDAPVAVMVCIDERLTRAQWLDLGLYMQSFMLLAVENGLGTCAQGFWRRYQAQLLPLLKLPEHYMVAVGIAVGYADPDARINSYRSLRDSSDEWLQLQGF